ncbi:MAG: caspase family protein, partial [Pseudomonadota bacterium]
MSIGVRTEQRYAIVIGNSDYDAIPDLPNAEADGRAVAQFLEAQGYIVKYHENLTKRGFEEVLRRALFDVDSDTEVVVFFAGHGFQIGSENYLVPVDADLDSVYDVPFEAVSLGSLVGIIGARARLQIVILDSCRDNPFAGRSALTNVGNELRETRTGFSSQAAPLNSHLIFSTSPGSVAYDGDGDNSPFTEALLEEAGRSEDAVVTEVFERVRRSVYEKTRGRQVPWNSSTMIEPASFGLDAALERPLPAGEFAAGVSRGVSRVAFDSGGEGPSISIVESAALIEADFVEQVEIGESLVTALELADDDSVTFLRAPDVGRLILTDPNGFRQNVVGRTLTGA